jgi:hypothetical protein
MNEPPNVISLSGAAIVLISVLAISAESPILKFCSKKFSIIFGAQQYEVLPQTTESE